MQNYNVAQIKAYLLASSLIKISDSIKTSLLQINNGNLIKSNWIFLRLNNNTRVRMTVSENAELILKEEADSNLKIIHYPSGKTIVEHIKIERVLAHAPEQLFFLLYKDCFNGCKFCPLTYKKSDKPHYSWERMKARIVESIPHGIQSIGITSSCPAGKTEDELVDELVCIIRKIRILVGENIPIGVSLKTPTKKSLLRLKDCGVCEMRLNLEIYNAELSTYLMPNKKIDEIIHSIKIAVDIFGKNKVSSNLIIGLGESDKDILNGIDKLAEIGAIATLYPYDPLDIENDTFKRPSTERIYRLALKHKEILEKHHLNPNELKTMCCACAASHLYPGKDL